MREFRKNLDPKPKDARDLARELIRQGKLTNFQARMVYEGKTHALLLGDYDILEKLGQGGMGMVFKARHRVMKRTVALKILPPSVIKSEKSVKRFHREAIAAAKLTHPNIVTAFRRSSGQGHPLFGDRVGQRAPTSLLFSVSTADFPSPKRWIMSCKLPKGLSMPMAKG